MNTFFKTLWRLKGIIHEDKDKNLRVVFEQYFLHARHVENERLWFTNIYAIVWAGSIAFMSEFGLEIQLAFFLLILSFLGVFMCHALRVPFIKYSRLAEIILNKEWHMKEYAVFSPRKSIIKGKRYVSGEIEKLISLINVFYFLYFLGIVGSTVIILLEVNWHCIVKIMFSVVVIIIAVVMIGIFIKSERSLHEQLGMLEKQKD